MLVLGIEMLFTVFPKQHCFPQFALFYITLHVCHYFTLDSSYLNLHTLGSCALVFIYFCLSVASLPALEVVCLV